MKSLHRLSRNPLSSLSILLFLLPIWACQPPTSTGSDAASPAESANATRDSSQSAPAQDQVSYEPAYPADVSAEGLDADDTAQQEVHAPGNAEHSHGDGDTHEHGSDEAPHGHGEGASHAH